MFGTDRDNVGAGGSCAQDSSVDAYRKIRYDALRCALGHHSLGVRFFSGRGRFQVVTLHLPLAHTFGGGLPG
jgi:hypothetical protein